MNTTITTKKIQTISLSLLLLMAAMTISMATSSIFADNDDDELEGEVGEEGEVIAKLVANNGDNNDKKNNVLLAPAPIVKKTQQTIVPVAEAQQQQQPPVKQQPAPVEEEEQQDKGMKLVLGDIVLPINQKSDFSLELPFSKIVVEPIK